MRGVELTPGSALVRPYESAMFHTHEASGRLLALLVGARTSNVWQPAIASVTIEHVIVQGVKQRHGPHALDIGWPLFCSARAPQSVVVFVRNDSPERRELRAVLVLDGDEFASSTRRRGRLSVPRGT